MELLLIAPSKNCLPNIPGFINHYDNPINFDAVLANINDLKPDLIIIPAEQSAAYLDSHLLGGLELFVWLRIKEIKTHIIITSFFSLQQIMQKVKLAFVLGSKGVSFQQTPSHQFGIDFNKLVDNRVEGENLKSYLSAVLDIANFRHAYANVWGLKRLIEVHKLFFPEFDDSKINYGAISSSLNYNIAEFVFKRKGLNIDRQISKNIHSALIEFSKKLNELKGLNVLFIDDKADTGWKLFLESLLKVKILTLDIKNIAADNLVKQFDDLTDIQVVISDLRLYTSEDNLTDYNQFKSIELLKYIFDKKHLRKLVYKNVRYVLFTASNQLLNYKNVVKSNKYTPSGVFIKEGFDIQINENQQEQNYLNLINSLYPAISESYNKQGGRIETTNDSELQNIERIRNALKENHWVAVINNIKRELDIYDYVLLDTNTYVHFNPYIALSKSSKLLYLYPVFKEIERIISTREATYRVFIGDLMNEVYKSNISKMGLHASEINFIDGKFEDGKDLKDFADTYFLQIIQSIKNNDATNSKKILLITNDAKPNSPYEIVNNWVSNSRIKNVQVLTTNEFYTTHKIDLPEKKNAFLRKENAEKYQNYNFIKLSTDKKYILLHQKNTKQIICVYIEGNGLGNIIDQRGVELLDNYDLGSIKMPAYPKWVKIDGHNYLKVSFNSVLRMLV